jgi:hypothetical protein
MMPASISIAGRRCDRDKRDNPRHPQPPTIDQHLNHAPLKSVDCLLFSRTRLNRTKLPARGKDSLPIW